MNPFQAIMGQISRPQTQMNQPLPVMPNAGFGGIFNQMQQIANMFQNPQQLVQRVFPDAPQEIINDPDQLVNWMQQTGKTNPQMIQMARQMLGR